VPDPAPARVLALGPGGGGVGDSFAQTMGHLRASGRCQIDVVRIEESPVPFVAARAAIRDRRAAIRRAEAIHVEFGSNDKTAFWLAWLLSRRRSITVVIHDYPLLVKHPAAGLLGSAPRWRSSFGHRVLSPLLDRWLKRGLLRRAGAVVVMNEEASQGWRSVTRAAPLVIPHGTFPASESATPPSDAGYALFAGFIGPSKGVDVLLEAWRRVGPRVPLELVVAGEPDASLRAKKTELEACEKPPSWLGFIESERELQRTIANAAVVVLPYRRSSPASGILARAMLEGRPVIATKVPAAQAAIRHDVEGLLVEPEDVEGLAAALERLALHPEQRDGLGAAARTRAGALFSDHKQVEILLSGYARSLERA
jgi:glycosyltransferase involved in cell wall biosynthesis